MMRISACLALAGLALGAAAPPQLSPLAVTTVSGQSVHVNQSQREVVIVHFWATWCAPCRIEMPLLDAVELRYGNQGVKIVGIALDAGASRQKIADAATGVSFSLARLADTNIRPGDVPAALPETLVYDRDGRLRYRFHGGEAKLDAATLERIIPPLVAGH